MAHFALDYEKIKYPIATRFEEGLRNAQLGAAHAISSHFTLFSDDPALVIMPTGSGKTAVLTLSPYLLRAGRVLVISSSVMVRGQIVDEFSTLKTLKKCNVFQGNLAPPKVYEIKSPIKSVEEWNEFRKYNVVVGIPNSINEGINEEFGPPLDLFDLILVDEAHHVPAYTWSNIVKNFSDAKKVYFTATPFRRDKKAIEARKAYYYPVAKAYEDKIFGDVGYYPVITDNPNLDLAIALEAEKIFLKDKEAGFEHFLMVRTESTDHAKALVELYAENTGLKLKRVDSTQTYSKILRTIDSLKAGDLDGIICVDMLGEGFDFPNLKIAAIHSPKKSLANTLQFIGRFARTNAENIGEAKFLAIPNDIEIGKKRLYAEGAIWNDIIKDLSEEVIAEEDETKEVLETFEKRVVPSAAKDAISFYNLNPYCHVKVYKAEGINLDAEINISSGQEIIYHAVSSEYNSIIFILRETEKPKWIASDDLINVKHHFLLIFFDDETKLLFIHSSIRTIQYYDEIVNTFAVGSFERVPKYQINKVLVDISDTEFFSIGMLNRNANSGESYRIMTGPNTENSVRKSHGKNYANGHVFLKGKSNGEKITIGYSSGAKVWSNSYQKIPSYIKWCRKLAEKIICDKEVKTHTGFDHLPIGLSVKQFELTAHCATWNHNTFIETPFLLVLDEGEPIARYDLLDFDISIDKDCCDAKQLTINLTHDGIILSFTYDFDKYFQYKIHPEYVFAVELGNQALLLPEYLCENPLHIFLDDFAAVINHEYFPPAVGDFQYNSSKIIPHNWSLNNTDITKEVYDAPAEKISNGNRCSVQESLQLKLLDENYQILIYDHGKGEVADYITFNESEAKIQITLYHVKGSGGDTPGDRVNDVYEVCMQAVKSQSWTVNKKTFKKKIRSRVNSKPHKFLVGDLALFSEIMDKSKMIEYSFAIVQPGLSEATFSEKLSYMLAAADDSIIHCGYSPLIVIGS